MKKKDKNKPETPGELLKRAAEDALNDDFEREAAEGFAMLGKEEAERAQSNVDKRMAVLLNEQKKPLLIYWSMAAGLLLVIGLTVFLMRDGGALEEPKLSHAETRATVNPAPGSHAPHEEQLLPPPPQQPAATGTRSDKTGTAAMEKKADKEMTAEGNVERYEEAPAAATGEPPAPAVDHTQEEAASADMDTKPEPQDVINALPPSPAVTGDQKKKRADAPAKAPAPEPYARDGAPARMSMSSGAVPSVTTADKCIIGLLKKKYPEAVSKKFVATITVRNGTVENVKFTRGSDLSGTAKNQIDSLMRLAVPGCVPAIPEKTKIKLVNEP